MPAILVSKRNRQQEIRDRDDAGDRELLRAGGPDARNRSDGIAQMDSPRRGRGAGRQLLSGDWKVSATSPNFSTSPFCTAMGTPVATRVPLT